MILLLNQTPSAEPDSFRLTKAGALEGQPMLFLTTVDPLTDHDLFCLYIPPTR